MNTFIRVSPKKREATPCEQKNMIITFETHSKRGYERRRLVSLVRRIFSMHGSPLCWITINGLSLSCCLWLVLIAWCERCEWLVNWHVVHARPCVVCGNTNQTSMKWRQTYSGRVVFNCSKLIATIRGSTSARHVQVSNLLADPRRNAIAD